MMKRSSLPREINALLAIGNAIADALAERQDDSEIHQGVEALLRAGIAAAEYSVDAYMAMLAKDKQNKRHSGSIPAAQVISFPPVTASHKGLYVDLGRGSGIFLGRRRRSRKCSEGTLQDG